MFMTGWYHVDASINGHRFKLTSDGTFIVERITEVPQLCASRVATNCTNAGEIDSWDASVYKCNTCLGPQATILGGAVVTLPLRNESALRRSSLMAPDPDARAKLSSLIDFWAILPNSCPSAKTNLPLKDSISDLRKWPMLSVLSIQPLISLPLCSELRVFFFLK